MTASIEDVVHHIAKFRSRQSVRILDVIYGPRAKALRTQVAAMMLDRKVTGSDKEAQYGNLRKALLGAAGVIGNCIALEDAAFEEAVESMLRHEDSIEREAR